MDIKIVCLNMWRGELLDNAVDFLKQQKADIIALQEVTNGQDASLSARLRLYESLQQRLNYEYRAFTPMLINNRAEGRIEEGVAVFSRFPLHEEQPVFFMPFRDDYVDTPENFATSSRCMQHVIVHTPSGDINLFNMHGIWDLEGDNYSPERQNMSRLICESVEGQKNVILMGDTNARPTNQAMRDVEEHLTSVFGSSVASTFNMRRKTNPGYATSAVDMMFVGPEFQVIQKDVPDVDASDHLPLVVTVRI